MSTLFRSRSTVAVTDPVASFTPTAEEQLLLEFSTPVWGNKSPHYWNVGQTREHLIEDGYIITGITGRSGKYLDAITSLTITPVSSGASKTVELQFGGGGGGAWQETATTGYALAGAMVFWDGGHVILGIQFLWRSFLEPTKYYQGPRHGSDNFIGCDNGIPGFECTRCVPYNGGWACGNGQASPRMVRAPGNTLDIQVDLSNNDPTSGYYSYYVDKAPDKLVPLMFCTGIRIVETTDNPPYIGSIQMAFTNFAAVSQIATNPRLQTFCCLGKGSLQLCGEYWKSTPKCDSLMTQLCNGVPAAQRTGRGPCACLHSEVKASVCYDTRCLADDAYRPKVMLDTFSPCPDLIECSQFITLPEDVKESIINSVQLKQTCTKDGDGATPINNNDQNHDTGVDVNDSESTAGTTLRIGAALSAIVGGALMAGFVVSG